MKKHISLLGIIILFYGCGQPQLARTNYINVNTDKYIKSVSLDTRKKAIKEAINKLVKEGVLKKGRYADTYVYTADGLSVNLKLNYYGSASVKVNYYDSYTPEKKQQVNNLIKKINSLIESKLNKIAEIHTKIKEILKKSPEKVIKIENNVLTEEQKAKLLKYIVKKIQIKDSNNPYGNYNLPEELSKKMQTVNKICLQFYSFDLKKGELFFHFKSNSCFYYYTLDKLLQNKQRIYLSDIYYLPQYTTTSNNITIHVSSSFDYNYKNFHDINKYVRYNLKFENIANDYFNIPFITFYHLEEVVNINSGITLPPMSVYKKSYLTNINDYNVEITKKNRNNLIYGIAFKINGQAISDIKTTTFDKLFDKYIK